MKSISELRNKLTIDPQEISSSIKYFKKLTIDWDVFLPTIGKNLQRDFVWTIEQKRSLIENGKCIVAGTECIWKGGIGNFIKTSNADDLVDCLVYDFDLKVFMTSWYYIDDLTEYVQDASEAAQKASIFYNDILMLKEKVK
jgi:hypothetical protein